MWHVSEALHHEMCTDRWMTEWAARSLIACGGAVPSRLRCPDPSITCHNWAASLPTVWRDCRVFIARGTTATHDMTRPHARWRGICTIAHTHTYASQVKQMSSHYQLRRLYAAFNNARCSVNNARDAFMLTMHRCRSKWLTIVRPPCIRISICSFEYAEHTVLAPAVNL